MAALNGVQISFSTAGPVGTNDSNIGLRGDTVAGQGMTSAGTSSAAAPSNPGASRPYVVSITNTTASGIFYTYGAAPDDPTSLTARRDYLASGMTVDRFCQRGALVRWAADA